MMMLVTVVMMLCLANGVNFFDSIMTNLSCVADADDGADGDDDYVMMVMMVMAMMMVLVMLQR